MGEDRVSDWNDVQRRISAAFADRALLKDPATEAAVMDALNGLDRGELRVAEKCEGAWEVNARMSTYRWI